MQCSYFIDGKIQCKNTTTRPTRLCHRHKRRYVTGHKFPRPKNCPVCYGSMHQCLVPLSCGHWVHKRCIIKSCKAECPLCRQELPEITCTRQPEDFDIYTFIDEYLSQPEFQRIDIPEDAIILAVLTYQLYAFILCGHYQHRRHLGLQHFVSGVINHLLPVDHPSHPHIADVVYNEALRIFFEPQFWTAAIPAQ